MSSAPLGPQFTAESDFPRQRAITKWGWSSASFSELIIKDSWGGEGKEATVSLIFCVLGVTIGNVGQPWSILCQRFVTAVMDFNRVWTPEECLEIIPVQKLKRSNALLYSFYPSTIILYPFFFFSAQRNDSHDPSSMQTNTILRRELQEVYYVMKHGARTKDYWITHLIFI